MSWFFICVTVYLVHNIVLFKIFDVSIMNHIESPTTPWTSSVPSHAAPSSASLVRVHVHAHLNQRVYFQKINICEFKWNAQKYKIEHVCYQNITMHLTCVKKHIVAIKFWKLHFENNMGYFSVLKELYKKSSNLPHFRENARELIRSFHILSRYLFHSKTALINYTLA